MKEEEFKSLMSGISASHSQQKDEFDYEGYGLVDNLKLTKGDVKKAVGIMWDLIMESHKDERNEKYLFTHGIIKSKKIFLERRDKITPESSQFMRDSFEADSRIFKKKLQNLEPLVHFLIKLKEVL